MTEQDRIEVLARQAVVAEAHSTGRFSEDGKPTRGRISEDNLKELEGEISQRAEILKAAAEAGNLSVSEETETFEKKDGENKVEKVGTYSAVEFKDMAGVLAYFGGSEQAVLNRLSKLITDSFRNAARNDAFAPDATQKMAKNLASKIKGGKVDKAALLAALEALG